MRATSYWRRRFWEHLIRDDEDFRRHVAYCYINPVKHGLVTRVRDWPHSSFHRDVRAELFPEDCAGPTFRQRATLANVFEMSGAMRCYGPDAWAEIGRRETMERICDIPQGSCFYWENKRWTVVNHLTNADGQLIGTTLATTKRDEANPPYDKDEKYFGSWDLVEPCVDDDVLERR